MPAILNEEIWEFQLRVSYQQSVFLVLLRRTCKKGLLDMIEEFTMKFIPIEWMFSMTFFHQTIFNLQKSSKGKIRQTFRRTTMDKKILRPSRFNLISWKKAIRTWRYLILLRNVGWASSHNLFNEIYKIIFFPVFSPHMFLTRGWKCVTSDRKFLHLFTSSFQYVLTIPLNNYLKYKYVPLFVHTWFMLCRRNLNDSLLKNILYLSASNRDTSHFLWKYTLVTLYVIFVQ